MEDTMKKLLFLMLCLVLALSFSLVSCGEDEPPADNSTNNPGDNGGNGGNTACTEHVGTVICEKCYTALYEGFELAIPEINSIGAKVTDIDVTITGDPDDSGTLTATIIEGYVTLDEDYMLQGYGKAVLTLTYSEYIGGRVDNLNADVFIEDNIIYISVVGDSFGSIDYATDFAYCVDVSKVAQLEEVKNQLETYKPMIEQYLPVVEEWFKNSLAPIFSNVDVSGATDTAKEYSARLINAFYTATENADGTTTLTFDLETLKTWNKALSEKTVAEIIDLVAGEGSFRAIEDLFANEKLYDFSVAQLLDYLKTEQGVDLLVLLDTIDTLVQQITGNETATLESLISSFIPPESGVTLPEDFGDILENEEYLALSVKDALQLAFEAETPEAAVAQFKAMAAPIITMLKENSAYDLIVTYMINSEVVIRPLPTPMSGTTEDEDMIGAMVEKFDAMIDMVSDCLTFTITADASDKITSVDVNIEVDMDGDMISCTVKATASQISIEMNVDVEEIGETVDMSIVATSEKITITYDINVEGDVDATFAMEILANPTGMTADADKLAAVKAKLNSAAEKITVDAIYALLVEDYSYSDRNVFLKDEENGLVYKVYVNYFDGEPVDPDTGLYNIEISVDVTVFYVNSYFVYGIETGCTNITAISPAFTVRQLEYTDLTFNSVALEKYPEVPADLFDFITLSVIEGVDLSEAEEELRNLSFTYNSETGEYAYNYYGDILTNGHDYVLADSYDGETCESINWDRYKCTVCQYEYTYYYTHGHDTEKDEDRTIVPETCNTKYTVYQKCTADGCDYYYTYTSETDHLGKGVEYSYNGTSFDVSVGCRLCPPMKDIGEITVDLQSSDVTITPYTELTPRGKAAFLITVSETRSVNIYSERTDDQSDPVGYLYSYADGATTELVYSDDYGGGRDFSISYTLAAGQTYLIEFGAYSVSPNYCTFILHII